MAVIEEYQDYLDQHPGCEQTSGHISAALRLGNLYLDIDQVDSAVDSIVATVNFPFIWDNLTEDMIDVVVELLRRAMNIDHTSSKILQALDQLLEEKSLTSQFSWFKGDLIELKGVWFQENGHLEEALGHYNLLHSHVMEHPDRDEAMEAWSLSRISLVLFHQHRYKEALKNFKRVLELDEASTKDSEEIFENYINIAITYWKLEDYWGSFECSQMSKFKFPTALSDELCATSCHSTIYPFQLNT
ncbi:Anaphase-promoting complex subunit Cut9 [Lasiodiplodia theobromae]|uniref:Anaphase-promoting complex subunit Cut9 n=1 Tax=Lasiodiplodia theobromae TaxID=45133 RepID=UPI0015C2DB28|nr:Anaphase-promoting complex subunit Cut9 [Lasiodiplodia theobromae]KAF4544633.1 Anaphase-promoting complex subunit Cut9 [Lasiodiplodia theobromae]